MKVLSSVEKDGEGVLMWLRLERRWGIFIVITKTPCSTFVMSLMRKIIKMPSEFISHCWRWFVATDDSRKSDRIARWGKCSEWNEALECHQNFYSSPSIVQQQFDFMLEKVFNDFSLLCSFFRIESLEICGSVPREPSNSIWFSFSLQHPLKSLDISRNSLSTQHTLSDRESFEFPWNSSRRWRVVMGWKFLIEVARCIIIRGDRVPASKWSENAEHGWHKIYLC